MRMHLLGLRVTAGASGMKVGAGTARRTCDRSRRLLCGGESGTFRLQSLQGGGGDLFISGYLVRSGPDAARCSTQKRANRRAPQDALKLPLPKGRAVLDRNLTLTH